MTVCKLALFLGFLLCGPFNWHISEYNMKELPKTVCCCCCFLWIYVCNVKKTCSSRSRPSGRSHLLLWVVTLYRKRSLTWHSNVVAKSRRFLSWTLDSSQTAVRYPVLHIDSVPLIILRLHISDFGCWQVEYIWIMAEFPVFGSSLFYVSLRAVLCPWAPMVLHWLLSRCKTWVNINFSMQLHFTSVAECHWLSVYCIENCFKMSANCTHTSCKLLLAGTYV